jgi:hypothetical protein
VSDQRVALKLPDSPSQQKRRSPDSLPWKCRGQSSRPFGRMGDDQFSAFCHVRRRHISPHLNFLRSDSQHKKAAPETAKPPAAASGFAFVPNPLPSPPFPQAAFGRVIEPGAAWVCTLSPLSFRDCGDAQSDRRSIVRLRVHGCAFQATLTKRITRAVCSGLPDN